MGEHEQTTPVQQPPGKSSDNCDPRMLLPQLVEEMRRGHFLPHILLWTIVTGVIRSLQIARKTPRNLILSFTRYNVALFVILVVQDTILLTVADTWKAVVPVILSAIWFVLASIAAFSQLPLVRRPDGSWYETFGVPNALTLYRFHNIPLILLIMPHFPDDRGMLLVGVGIFTLVALSDTLDGNIARLTRHVSEFGRIYDPISDIAFNAGVGIAAYAAGYIPLWYLLLAETRFALPLLGGAWVFVYSKPWKITPTIWGKTTVFIYAVFIALLLLKEVAKDPTLNSIVEKTLVISGILFAFNLALIVDRGLTLVLSNKKKGRPNEPNP